MKTSLISLIFWGSTAFAAWSDIGSMEFVMAPPPEVGSATYRADFVQLLELQENRTPGQCRMASRMRFPEYTALFGHTQLMTDEEFQLTRPLLERVVRFTNRVSTYHKDKFDRPRPYNVDTRIQPCADRPTGSKSYPSSHATVASAASCVLSEVFPARAEELETYGRELGDLRAIIGVHHPSDVLAGQKLGQEICARLKTEADFQEQLKELQSELD